MATTTVNGFGVPMSVQDLYDEINIIYGDIMRINADYPRTVGNMVMVSSEKEDEIERLVNVLENDVNIMREHVDEADDSELLESTLDFLDSYVKANREEITRARDFLARYQAI